MSSRQQADPILAVPAAAADNSALARSTRRRVTRRLIPYLMFIYLLAYLDRANVGVAKLQMQQDLDFSEAVIGFGAGIFFLGYLLLDIPGSLIVERWSARKWIAPIMVAWGSVAVLMGLVGTPLFGAVRPVTQFYALRLLLGIAEAGFFPGVIVYLSHWYRLEDRARAKAWFMITQPISAALGIPASRWILENIHWASLAGWRWVFILEGLPPMIMGVVTWWYLTDHPTDARWLPADEKQWLIGELSAEAASRTSAGRVRAAEVLRHPQMFLLTAIFFLIVTGNQALLFFLPSITENMHSLPVAVRTAAAGTPYVCSVLGILLNGMWAHRTGRLRWHTAAPLLAAAVFLSLAILAGDRIWLAIAMLCLTGFAAQAYLPAFFTLPTAILGKSAAAVAIGLICLGNLGGFVGPWLFGYLKTSTGRYETGMWVLAGCMFLAGALATCIRVPRSSAASSHEHPSQT